jgi:hypothetical protein
MNINIQFNNNNYLIKTKKYQSIYSLINQFIDENKIEYSVNDLFLDYNGCYLDNNLSLEKYNIDNDYKLNLNIKIKGGNSFLTFLKKHPFVVIFSLLISLLPLFILPTGFMPSLASLIENIIQKSISSIGKYLSCFLGKKTLYNRIQWIIIFIKYSIFFLMVYVIITLPLTLLCITIKGHNIIDSPSSMCSPIKISNYTGVLLTMFFIFLYGYFRIGDIVLSFFINIFKKFYITDTIFNPILVGLLNLYDEFKYTPIYIIPYIGVAFKTYFTFLDVGVIGFQSVLSAVNQIGCKMSFNKKSFMEALGKTLNQGLKENKNTNKKNSPEVPSNIDGLCIPDVIKCCNPSNFINIANVIKQFIEISAVSSLLKFTHLYSFYILIIEALYEYALSNLGISGKIPNNANDRVDFFKDILQDKSNKLSSETVNLIKEYLTTFNPNLITNIETKVDTDLSNDLDKVQIINDNLLELENLMIIYSHETGSKYVSGPSLFKIVIKYIFLNGLCNVFQTTKTSLDVIDSMKGVHNISDMIKAGTSTGVIITLFYLIALIVLICMGIFDKY